MTRARLDAVSAIRRGKSPLLVACLLFSICVSSRAETITVNSTPAGAAIWYVYNGGALTNSGQITPFTFSGIPAGEYQVHLFKTGYQDWSETRTLLADEEITSFAELDLVPDQVPAGAHDGSDCTISTGWTCDPDNFALPVDVHFYADGPAGSGTFLGVATASQTREPAVGAACGGNANHGFSFATPSALKDGAPHDIYAYAINLNVNNNPLLGGSPKTITCASSDTTPPTVSISAPTSGSTVSGSITFTASASDNVGVSRVDYLYEGIVLCSGATGPGFGCAYNTVGAANGTYSVTAKAYDAAGNAGASEAISVTVSNAVGGPPDYSTPLFTPDDRVPLSLFVRRDDAAATLALSVRPDILAHLAAAGQSVRLAVKTTGGVLYLAPDSVDVAAGLVRYAGPQTGIFTAVTDAWRNQFPIVTHWDAALNAGRGGVRAGGVDGVNVIDAAFDTSEACVTRKTVVDSSDADPNSPYFYNTGRYALVDDDPNARVPDYERYIGEGYTLSRITNLAAICLSDKVMRETGGYPMRHVNSVSEGARPDGLLDGAPLFQTVHAQRVAATPDHSSLATFMLPPGWSGTASSAYPVLFNGFYDLHDNFALDEFGRGQNFHVIIARLLSSGRGREMGILWNGGGSVAAGAGTFHRSAYDNVALLFDRARALYGADTQNILTIGGSRGGLTALMAAANPYYDNYRVRFAVAMAPPVKVGEHGTRYINRAYPALHSITQYVTGYKGAWALNWRQPGTNRPFFEAMAWIEWGVLDAASADAISPWSDTHVQELQRKGTKLWLRFGTHDAFMPFPLSAAYIDKIRAAGIPLRTDVGYRHGHGFPTNLDELEELAVKLLSGDPSYATWTRFAAGMGTTGADYFTPEHVPALLEAPREAAVGEAVTLAVAGAPGAAYELRVRRADTSAVVLERSGTLPTGGVFGAVRQDWTVDAALGSYLYELRYSLDGGRSWINLPAGQTPGSGPATLEVFNETSVDRISINTGGNCRIGACGWGLSGDGLADPRPPSAAITSPVDAASVSGQVTVSGAASDNLGVTKVEFYMDGALKATVAAEPFAFTFDSTLLTNGAHTLVAKAYDGAGNVGASEAISLTVSNVVPDQVPTGAHDGSDCTTSTGWACDPDNFGLPVDVHFYADGPAGSGTFLGVATASQTREPAVGAACGGNANHGFSFATPGALKDGAPHDIYAYAINLNVNDNPLLGGSPKTITCGAADATPPTVSISAPTNGSTVSGSITFTAAALDNLGVTKVEFYMDGALKAIVAAEPFAFTLDTTLLTNGAHTVFAKAYDAAGNVGASVAIPFTVNNAGVVGTPGAPSATVGSTGSIVWSWTAAGGATSYELALASKTAEIVASPAGASAALTGFKPNSLSEVVVRGLNTFGAGEFSARGSAYSHAAAPVTLTVVSVTTDTASLSWGANGNPGGTRFELETSEDGGPFALSSATVSSMATVTGLLASTAYEFRVRAANGNLVPTAYAASVTTRTLPALPGVPGTPPAVPGVPTAVALSTGDLRWSWAPAAFATSYRLVRASAPAQVLASVSTTTVVLSGFSPNSLSGVAVQAVNETAVSALTAAATAHTLALAPASLSIVQVGTAAVLVGWDAGTNPSGTRFEVQSSTDNTTFVPAGTTSAATFSVAPLESGATYYVRVRAENGDAILTAFSNVASTFTLPPLPAAPGTPVGAALSASAVSWSWGAAFFSASYEVLLASKTSELLAATTATAVTLSGFTPNQASAIVVRGVNVTGVGPQSSSSTAVYTLANPPSGTAAAAVYATSATLTWDLNGNPAQTSAELQRSTDGAAFSSFSVATTTSRTDVSLLVCSSYYFRVRNYNGAGVASGFDAALSLLTSASSPTAPGGLRAAPATGNRIVLGWEPSPSESVTAYRIYWDAGTGTVSYAAPLAVVTSSVSSFTTGVLTSSAAYRFALRAFNRCGLEDGNTGVLASAPSVTALSGVSAAVTSQQSGKRVKGNRVTLSAAMTVGAAAATSQVVFQFRPSSSTSWVDIATDTVEPYFVHWDADALGLAIAQSFDVRAVASDLAGTPDAAPSAVTLTVVPAGSASFDVSEGLVGGKVQRSQALDNAVNNTLVTGGGAGGVMTKLQVPAGALSDPNVVVMVVNDPAGAPAAPAGVESIGVVTQVTLGNGQTTFSGGKTVAVTLGYPDENGDGVVDGTTVRADRLRMYSAATAAGPWVQDFGSSLDPANRSVTGNTPHFSFFALFVVAASDLASLRVYPVPFMPNNADADDGVPYAAGNANSGIVFDNLPAAATIEVFTVTGQRVAKFTTSSAAGRVQWDVKNDRGADVASGGYVAVVSSPGVFPVIKKLLVVR